MDEHDRLIGAGHAALAPEPSEGTGWLKRDHGAWCGSGARIASPCGGGLAPKKKKGGGRAARPAARPSSTHCIARFFAGHQADVGRQNV